MGKGFKLILLSIMATSMLLTACGGSNNEKDTKSNDTVKFIENTKKSEVEKMKTMKIMVGSNVFTVKLYDNKTTRALLSQLPMTVDMTELNGREKYYHLSKDLPVESSERPETIHAGEIMCWSSNSLVLFYNTFSNSYSGYVRIGYIEDVSDLASSLGKGNVQVTFATSD
jgi:hypothetical protein